MSHLSIIEKAMYTYYQNIAKLLTHLSILRYENRLSVFVPMRMFIFIRVWNLNTFLCRPWKRMLIVFCLSSLFLINPALMSYPSWSVDLQSQMTTSVKLQLEQSILLTLFVYWNNVHVAVKLLANLNSIWNYVT